jgi:hypothetical protein
MWSVAYQRARDLPPPNPPPNPPDREPPECGGRGFAMLTVSGRPSKGCSFSFEIAAWASSLVDISTKPKPRDRPENLSVITEADSTVPHWAKYSRRLSEVVE